MDGAMGTMIQQEKLVESDFRVIYLRIMNLNSRVTMTFLASHVQM